MEKGIDEKIKNISFVINSDYLPIIFIETETNSYFWIYKGSNFKSENLKFEYDIYTVEGFQERATEHFADIYLDGKKIEGQENVLVRWDKKYIRTAAFIDIIGGKDVMWDNNSKSVIFELNGKKIEYVIGTSLNINNKHFARIFVDGKPYYNTYCILLPMFVNDYIYFDEDYVNLFLNNVTNKEVFRDKTTQNFILNTNTSKIIEHDLTNALSPEDYVIFGGDRVNN